MFKEKATVERISLPSGKRILVISDIHGNLPYFRALLEKAGFCGDDILVIDGDFVEKGEYSLDTLRYIMKLCAGGNVRVICGNCDDWHDFLHFSAEGDAQVLQYLRSRRRGLIWDMCMQLHIDPDAVDSITPYKEYMVGKFAAEFRFLAGLPQAIETDNYIFVHAGIHGDKPLEEHTAHELRKYDDFMNRGHRFDKWVIVGHWPVMLYCPDRVCANPIIDRNSRIISIDGGCVLKDDGQLNALVIPYDGSETFTHIAYDPFPVAIAKDYQPEGTRSYYIRWGDSRVQVLDRGEEFSRCRHVRTGYEMDILTKYLFEPGEFTGCNDCTDYVPEICPGDEVSIVETTSRGYFVKHNGYSGWYSGEIEYPSADDNKQETGN